MHQILFKPNKTSSKSTFVMENFGCLVNLASLLVEKVDFVAVVKKEG